MVKELTVLPHPIDESEIFADETRTPNKNFFIITLIQEQQKVYQIPKNI